MLSMALLVHGGIAVAMGMPTFGLAMIIGNLAFVPAPVMRGVVEYVVRRSKEMRFGKSAAGSSLPAAASKLARCGTPG
jgi:hypothetical protein